MGIYATYTIIWQVIEDLFKLSHFIYLFLNPQIGQSLICYDCPSYGAECAKPYDENFGELMECPDSPNAACLTIYRLIYIKRTHSTIHTVRK